MKNKMLIAIIACTCLTMQFANGQQNAKQTKNNSNVLKQKAIQLLSGLEGAVPVASTDNLIGLSVDSVKKSGDGYDVYLKCSNKIVRNNIPAVTGTSFIDAENYKNLYKPYTVGDDGMLNFTFQSTSDGTAIIPVKLKPASKVMFVYFKGVKDPEPAEAYTVPLFFTIVLGNEPFVLEQTPRHAGTLFDEALK